MAVRLQSGTAKSFILAIAGIGRRTSVATMNNTILSQRTNIAVVVSAMLFTALTAIASPKPESVLLSAGFKTKVATTAKQRQELKTLPAGQVSPVTQKGKTFYIYPDAARNRIYAGNETEYQKYQGLITKTRGSDGPIVKTDLVRGNPIKVREFYGFGPLDDMR